MNSSRVLLCSAAWVGVWMALGCAVEAGPHEERARDVQGATSALSACEPPKQGDQRHVCHATGSAVRPYVKLRLPADSRAHVPGESDAPDAPPDRLPGTFGASCDCGPCSQDSDCAEVRGVCQRAPICDVAEGVCAVENVPLCERSELDGCHCDGAGACLDSADADSDETPDVCDPCPADPFDDTDGDGLCGDVDNCPEVDNVRQLDADADGIGNPCDDAPFGDEPAEFVPTEATELEAEIELDALFYAAGEGVHATLTFHGNAPDVDVLHAALSAPDSQDVELLELQRQSAQTFASSAPVVVRERVGAVEAGDGVLTLEPGEAFFALYMPDRTQPPLDRLQSAVFADMGVLEDSAPPGFAVDIGAALTEDELAPGPRGRPVGSLVRRGGLPVQIATRELVYYAPSDAALQAFLDETNGSLIASEPLDAEEGFASMHLVAVSPTARDAARMRSLLDILGDDGEYLASTEEVYSIGGFVLQRRLEGHIVTLNPRLQFHVKPSSGGETRSHALRTRPPNRRRGEDCIPRPRLSSGPLPAEAHDTCVQNVPGQWAFMELWDLTDRRVEVAVLDQGFAINGDFMQPPTGQILECDMGPVFGNECGPGTASGPPTVGASFFGDKTWHGNGVVSILGAVVNNEFGVAGVAGQVAVPQLYKYDASSYAFEIGQGIRRAADNGASCVNVSAGFPCRAITNSFNYDICSVAGRLALCGELVAAVAAAVGTTCAVAGWIPYVGPIACGVAIGVGAVVAGVTVSSCIASLALEIGFGNVRGAVLDGVSYAARRGVPVITSAGNALTENNLPPVLREFVVLDDQRVETWEIIPAMAPEAIAVGAVEPIDREPETPEDDLDNTHFYGDAVLVWAPETRHYYAPEDVDDPDSDLRQWDDFGATSAAAPYVTGVVAAMQAVNPGLDPTNPNLTDLQRRQIPLFVKELLLNSSFSNSQLVALGFTDQPERRRRLVNPLGAVQLAAGDRVPDLTGLGYDDTLGFSEAFYNDDFPGQPRPIALDRWETGTIVQLQQLSLRGYPTLQQPRVDIDYFELPMPTIGEIPVVEIELALRYPSGRGNLVLEAAGIVLQDESDDGTEQQRTYRVPGLANQPFLFNVGPVYGQDNVYKVRASDPVIPRTRLELVEPTSPRVCAGVPIRLRAVAELPDFPDYEIPDSRVYWYHDGLGIGAGRALVRTFQAGSAEIEVQLFGDPPKSERMVLDVIACEGLPPEVEIVFPPGPIEPGDTTDVDNDGDIEFDIEGFDAVRGLWYADIPLAGRVLDPEGLPVAEADKVWTTSRTDLQDAFLGAGGLTRVRLYSDRCEGTEHEIRFQATDADGNQSAVAHERVNIWQICGVE